MLKHGLHENRILCSEVIQEVSAGSNDTHDGARMPRPVAARFSAAHSTKTFKRTYEVRLFK